MARGDGCDGTTRGFAAIRESSEDAARRGAKEFMTLCALAL